eukprot:jgi/Tetstr1/441485/TSEL_029717.t1
MLRAATALGAHGLARPSWRCGGGGRDALAAPAPVGRGRIVGHVVPLAPTVCHGRGRGPRGVSCRADADHGSDWMLWSAGSEGVKRFDAVVVLAGGQREGGSGLPAQVEVRLDACLELMQRQGPDCAVLCTGGGTPHKPPIMRGGYVYHESTSCADYLIERGMPPERILKEVSSFDTIGNGYFSATIHALPRRWRRLAVITSEFHMPRSKAIFDHCYGLAGECFSESGVSFDLTYIAVSDDCIPDDILEARREREAASLAGFQRTVRRTPSLAEFSHWMHTEHLCYAVPRQVEPHPPSHALVA